MYNPKIGLQNNKIMVRIIKYLYFYPHFYRHNPSNEFIITKFIIERIL